MTVRDWIVPSFLSAAVLLASCGDGEFEHQHQLSLTGQYSAVTDDGRAITMDIEEQDDAVRIAGIIDGKPFAGSAARQSVARGALINEAGGMAPVEIEYDERGKNVVIRSARFGDLALSASEHTAQVSPPGQFSGTYRARAANAVLAELRVVQNGRLIAGTGRVFGSSVGFTGRERDDGQVEGNLLYSDGTWARVRVVQLNDGEIEVNGLNGVYRMVRQ